MDYSLPGSSVHGVARVRHDLPTKPPPPQKYFIVYQAWDLDSQTPGLSAPANVIISILPKPAPW